MEQIIILQVILRQVNMQVSFITFIFNKNLPLDLRFLAKNIPERSLL
jgi:hypothetical protein